MGYLLRVAPGLRGRRRSRTCCEGSGDGAIVIFHRCGIVVFGRGVTFHVACIGLFACRPAFSRTLPHCDSGTIQRTWPYCPHRLLSSCIYSCGTTGCSPCIAYSFTIEGAMKSMFLTRDDEPRPLIIACGEFVFWIPVEQCSYACSSEHSRPRLRKKVSIGMAVDREAQSCLLISLLVPVIPHRDGDKRSEFMTCW